MNVNSISKYISYLLRHHPEDGNLALDKEGYCDVYDLIKAVGKKYKYFTFTDLLYIVSTDEKGRYSFNEDCSKIRANQGHSTKFVDISFKEVTPPDILYHGTSSRFLNSILKEGLKPMSRQYVHLSKDTDTAIKVGKRHGDACVIVVDCKKMVCDGYKFYLSDNGVYLIKEVPAKYLYV